MTLKDKINTLKEAAIGIDLPSDKDTFKDVQRRRLEKQRRFGITPKIDVIQKRIDKLGSPKTTTQGEENARNQYINFGTKIRPPKTAQENKEKLRQMFAAENDPAETVRRFAADKSKKPEGFIYLDKPYDAFNIEHAKEIRRQIGKPGKQLGIIGTTTRNTPEETLEDLTRVQKERGHHHIGGYKGKVEASYHIDFDKDEELDKLLGTEQESALAISPENKARLIINRKYKPKEAQFNPDLTRQPLQVVFQGKRYAHMGKLDIGHLNYDETDQIKDLNSISIILINASDNVLTKFALETNMPKDAYKIKFPYKIAAQERDIATLFLMGSKINNMPKNEPLRLKFTYKEKEL